MFAFVFLGLLVFVLWAVFIPTVAVGDDGSDQSIDERCVDDNDVEIGPSCSPEPSSQPTKKKRRSGNKDHARYHPKLGCKFTVLWDDTNQVGDEIGDNLHRKLSAIATDSTLLQFDIPWTKQDKNNLKDAMRAVKVRTTLNVILICHLFENLFDLHFVERV